MIFRILMVAGILIAVLRVNSQIQNVRKRKILTMRRRFYNAFGFEAPKPRFNKNKEIHQLIKNGIEKDLMTLADVLLDKRSEIDRLTDVLKQKSSLGGDYIQYIEAELEIEMDENSELEAEINEKRLLCRYFKIPVEKDIWDYSWDKIITRVKQHQNSPKPL